MKRTVFINLVAALILACGAGAAQTNNLTLSCPNPSGRPGGQLQMSVNYSGAAIAGLEFNLGTLPAGFSAITVAGPAATAVQKSAFCNASGTWCLIAPSVGGGTILGGQTTFTSGIAATVTFTLPSTPGNYVIGPSVTANTLGASTTGTAVAVTVGNPLSVAVLSRFDINGDGKVDATDLALAEAQAVGTTPCTTADFNGDSKCDVTDVELLVLASLGVIPQ